MSHEEELGHGPENSIEGLVRLGFTPEEAAGLLSLKRSVGGIENVGEIDINPRPLFTNFFEHSDHRLDPDKPIKEPSTFFYKRRVSYAYIQKLQRITNLAAGKIPTRVTGNNGSFRIEQVNKPAGTQFYRFGRFIDSQTNEDLRIEALGEHLSLNYLYSNGSSGFAIHFEITKQRMVKKYRSYDFSHENVFVKRTFTLREFAMLVERLDALCEDLEELEELGGEQE